MLVQCNSWKVSSFRRYSGLQNPNLPDLNPVDYSVWSIQQGKHASLIAMTSNIAWEPSGPSWITPSLLQRCISGAVIFQLVLGRAMVISSTAFNSDIVFFCHNCGLWSLCWLVDSNSCRLILNYIGPIFLQLSVMTLCILIHDNRLIHKVK